MILCSQNEFHKGFDEHQGFQAVNFQSSFSAEGPEGSVSPGLLKSCGTKMLFFAIINNNTTESTPRRTQFN